MLDRYQFEILKYLKENKCTFENLRELSSNILISFSQTKKELGRLLKQKLVIRKDYFLLVTPKGSEFLEKYRVNRAIILGAGFGSRMMPATKNCPKPLVKVNGKRIIETQLDALVASGIKDITIVRGYNKEKYDVLLSKYPFLNFIDNDDYDKTNNISSVMKVLNKVRGGTYICEADLYLINPNVIDKYQYASNILGSYSLQTDDWSFRMKDGYIIDYQQGNTYCYNYYGISYWTAEDCNKLRHDWSEIYSTQEGKQLFWEFIPLKLRHDNYQVEIRQCRKEDIMEIDNYFELTSLDKSYPKIS
ncbi:phosphocholine cytidylyltransferase family protein [Limosilactobacillus reuteri]|uniref:phosphocholine cytidylyltransferase family protein n=1 Tax=Limosilactobacillus reuteri TaxID=1598 RepID=UPI001E56F71F|nr:phosphocholine cytidylyltransferase family protein [Limosilactobacillus reuteri]MCC4481321.1 phosphocholine cytidylyltransferase family protein [Limosilactobacillus reuteri]